MDGGKGLAPRPYHLCGVDLDGGEDADGEAGEDGAEHDVAARVLYLFRHGGDAIESDVGEHGDGSTVEECARGEKLRVVQRHQPRSADRAQDDGNVMEGEGEKDDNHDAYAESQKGIDPRGGLHAAQVERGKDQCEGKNPCGIRNGGRKSRWGAT